MPLKDILRKKDKLKDDAFPPSASHNPQQYQQYSFHQQQQQQQQQHQYPQYPQQEPFPPAPPSAASPAPAPEFKFFRSDTHSTELIQPPSFDDRIPLPTQPDPRYYSQSQSQAQTQQAPHSHAHPPPAPPSPTPNKRFSRFRRSSNASTSVSSGAENLSPARDREKGERRLSQRLHLNRSSRSASTSSVNVPADLPQIEPATGDVLEREAQWEKRATIMVQGGLGVGAGNGAGAGLRGRSPSPIRGDVKEGDENIQEAIRLHEAGDLEASTRMFGVLADPNGANNPLSQVLYGLALRHGWGCTPDVEKAVTYLSAAASNSASIEEEALRAGMKKGGAAKGELVLAIYELANCFRNGWGVKKDPYAARQYYETAANLGDTDAMNEAGWCFLEGFGTKKDRYMAAKYYRLAEENGNKTLGNSWIWKEKYNPK